MCKAFKQYNVRAVSKVSSKSVMKGGFVLIHDDARLASSDLLCSFVFVFTRFYEATPHNPLILISFFIGF